MGAMRFRRNCLIIAIVCLSIWIVGCTMHLNPALDALNNGKELNDDQVDIRAKKCGWLETQLKCTMFSEHPIASVLSLGTIGGCAYLRCAEDKEWSTDKICTCQIYHMFSVHLIHEERHCRGWVH